MFSWKQYTAMFILKSLRAVSVVLLPLLLWLFLFDLENESQQYNSVSSFLLVAGMLLLAFIKGISKNHFIGLSEIWGTRLKVASIGLVYKKILRELNRSDIQKILTGKTINLVSNDAQKLEKILWAIFLFLFVPLEVLASCIILWLLTGWLALAGVAFYAIIIVYVTVASHQTKHLRVKSAAATDKRLEVMNEILSGIRAVKIYAWEMNFTEAIKQLRRYQDENTSALTMVITSTQWLSLRMTLVCSLMVAAVAFGAVLASQSPALAGMSLAFLLESLDEVQYGIRSSSEVENLMTSAERVMSYTALETEPGYSTESYPPESWPQSGSIAIRNLSLKYVEGGPRVLRDVNVSVSNKEKIGVAGRTGAGKSSIVAAILRMPEPEGQVFIDGVDIRTLNLQSARRSMAVIAQDPVLFGGSLRRNMDPFSRYTDVELWSALEGVQLKEKVEKLPGQLNYQLKEAGSNFSVGERQLVCLARALVQKSKVIIMDEATANVDFKTDRLIQEVIRAKFKDSTVLTIAHRLNTIMDYDKVLVLNGGRVVEFDKPKVLIRNGGLFAELVKHASRTRMEAH